MCIRYSILFICLAAIFSCQKESKNAEFTVLSTNEVSISGTTEKGVLLSAAVMANSKETILEQGFVYGITKNPSLGNSLVVMLEEQSRNNFSIAIVDPLMPDITYYVRSFVRTEHQLIYGNQVEFYSNGSEAPVINTIEPSVAFWGDTIKITGENFDHTGTNNKVFIGDYQVEKIWGSTDSIFVVVPEAINNKYNEVTVSLYGKTSKNSKEFKIKSPVIYGISRKEGQYPDTVTIIGNYFSQSYLQLNFGELKLIPITMNKRELMFEVPYLGDGENIKVAISQLEEEVIAESQFKYNKQGIDEIFPKQVFADDAITIYATNLNFKEDDIKVKIDNTYLTYVEAWQDSAKVINPDSWKVDKTLESFNFNVLVKNYGEQSEKSIYQTNLVHRSPEIIKVINPQLGFENALDLEVLGLYGANQIVDILVETEYGELVDIEPVYGRFYNSSERFYQFRLPIELIPGKYQLQLSFYDRLSNKVEFEVMEPVITSFGTGKDYWRNDAIEFQGEYLPVSSTAYSVKHIESGLSRAISTKEIGSNWFQCSTQKVYGEGEYKLEINIGDKVYSSTDIISVKDIFQVQAKSEENIPFYSYYYHSLIADNILYGPNYNSAVTTYAQNIATGERIDVGESFYPQNNKNCNPVYCNQVWYSIFNNRLYHFNPSERKWEMEEYDFEESSIYLLCDVDNVLYVFSEDEKVYNNEGGWHLLGVNDALGYARFAHYRNGFFYFWYASYGLIKMSVVDWTATEYFSPPVWYDGGVKLPQHVFYKNNKIYLAYERRGTYRTELLYFDLDTETYTHYENNVLPDDDNSYRFALDEEGQVYMALENWIYKFNPE